MSVGGVRWFIVGVGGVVALVGQAGFSSSVTAEEMTREIARLRILDSCIYSEWTDEKKRDTAAERCKCAAGKLTKAMTDAELKAYARARKLTSKHQEKWDAAMDACTKG